MENLSCVIVSLLFIGLGSIVKTQGDIAPNYDFETYKVLEPKQPLVLQCNVTGTDQKYSLKWFKEDQPIEQPSDEKDTRVKIVDAEHKLIINKPNEDDIANYTCRMVHSSVNSSALDLNATITVVGRPTVRMPSTMSLVEGEKLVLDCSVNGKPTPEVVWSFGNVSINETSGRYKLLEDNGVPNAILSIDEVIMDDRGDYTCFAKNVANFTKATTYVRVEAPASSTIEGKEKGYPKTELALKRERYRRLMKYDEELALVRLKTEKELGCIQIRHANAMNELQVRAATAKAELEELLLQKEKNKV